MAKKQSLASTAFYIFLSVMALNYISLLMLIGWQYYNKQIGGKDLLEMAQVLVGNRKYTMPNKDYQRYQEFLADEQKFMDKLNLEKGKPSIRVPAAEAAREAEKIQQENAETLRRLLEAEQKRLAELRDEVEGKKKQLELLDSLIVTRKTENAKTELDADRENLKKAIAGMDAADLANFLQAHIQRSGKEEVARYMRQLMKPRQITEVLTEMDPGTRQQILPILENKYAGWSPEALVREWTNPKSKNFLTPSEIALYLAQMPAPKAFAVYSQLNPIIQAKVIPLLARDLQSTSR
jgi:flagellar motility protein MotE (MotC chaperone)